ILQGAGDPVDPAFGKHDPQRRMTIENAAENEIAEHTPEGRRLHNKERAETAAATRRGYFTDVKANRKPRLLRHGPETIHLGAGVVDGLAVDALARTVRQHE